MVLYLRITMVYVTFSFFLLAAVDAAIGSVLVLRWTEFKAVHFADYVLTSFGCARDYQSSSDFTGSHASGFDKVSTLNGNCDVLLPFVAFLVHRSMARKMGGHCGSDTRRYGIFCLLMCCWKRFCGWLLVRAGWSESCHLIGYPSEKDAHFVPAPKISLLPVFVFRNH